MYSDWYPESQAVAVGGDVGLRGGLLEKARTGKGPGLLEVL